MYQLVLILVADDEGIRPLLASMIDAGFRVKVSCSTDEALAQLRSAVGAYQAVMIDPGLAFESRSEAVRRVHDVDSSMPILDFTGKIVAEDFKLIEDHQLRSSLDGLISTLKGPHHHMARYADGVAASSG